MKTPHRVLDITTGTVSISGVTITGGNAESVGNGGGIKLEGTASLTLSNVAVSANTTGASGGSGGGIEASSSTHLTISASTISNNVTYNGGGLSARGTTVITNSTISGNHAGDSTHNGDSGGIEGGASVTLINDTIANNECFNGEGCGGGIAFGTYTVTNTIIANNLAGNISNEEVVPSNCSGTIADTGPNLENGSDCAFGAHGGISSTNPLLGPLADNGGATETQGLLAGSPGIDHGTNVGCPATDQRGVPRPQGAACDIGAVEHTVPSASTPVVSGVTTTGATLSAIAGTAFIGGRFSYRYGPTIAYGSSTLMQPLLEGVGTEAAVATLAGLAPATTYHAQLVVSTPDGSATSGDVTFTTASAPSAPTLVPPPTVTGVSQAAARWREGNKLAKISRRKRKPPVGTTFSFLLNEQAALTFSFTRRISGRKVKGKCVAESSEEPPQAGLRAHRYGGHALLRRPQRHEQGGLPGAHIALKEAQAGALLAHYHSGQQRRPEVCTQEAQLHDREVGLHKRDRLLPATGPGLATSQH